MTALPQTAAPTLRLTGVVNGRPWTRELGAGVYTLGSSRQCNVRLVGEGVSRQHATLRVHDQGLLVEDLGSKNGLFIEGRRVLRGVVPSGARLGVGPVEFSVSRVTEGSELAISFDGDFLSESSAIGSNSETHWFDPRVVDELRSARVGRPAVPALRFPSGYVPGRSPAMTELYRQMATLCRSRRPVLLYGETGVGKELLARTLHDSSVDPRSPYLVVNCAAIPGDLLESEMFGIVRGAASGVERRRGYFEQAEGGTLFLDEIGELAPALQAKLLRVLQEGEIQPVGGQPRRVDVWVIAATNIDLEGEGLRRDLFYRLAGGTDPSSAVARGTGRYPEADAPSAGTCRQRCRCRIARDDPRCPRATARPGLAWQRAAAGVGPPTAGRRGVRARWHRRPARDRPGLCPTARNGLGRNPAKAAGSARSRVSSSSRGSEALERGLIVEAMRRTGGRKIRAAKLLGVSRSGLDKMLRRLDIGSSWARSNRADGSAN